MRSETLFSSEWEKFALEELTLDGAVTYGVVQPGPPVTDGVPMLRVNNFRGYGLDTSDVMRISTDVEAKYQRTRVRTGDVLITVVGSVGQVAVVPERLAGWNLARAVALLRPRDPALSRWISLCLRSPGAQHSLGTTANTTVQTTINLKDLRKLQIPLPGVSERTAIEQTLGALDDRIDLLRQTNATLESIAQALFKSWFIDFDPVRAKAEGREPEGMDAATAALFPAEFEESTLGLIPKGWRVGAVADAVQLNPSRALSKGIEARYLEMANAPTNGHRPLERVGLRAFGSGCKFRNGDALLAKITPCLENGKSAFVDFLDDHEVGWGSTEFIVLRSKPVLPEFAAYLLARHEPFRQFAIQAMTGTSGRQRVELSRLAQFPMALPPNSSVAEALEPTLQALQSRIAGNDEQAKHLADLRDTLLPRLISGKLRLPEAQEQVAEVIA